MKLTTTAFPRRLASSNGRPAASINDTAGAGPMCASGLGEESDPTTEIVENAERRQTRAEYIRVTTGLRIEHDQDPRASVGRGRCACLTCPYLRPPHPDRDGQWPERTVN